LLDGSWRRSADKVVKRLVGDGNWHGTDLRGWVCGRISAETDDPIGRSGLQWQVGETAEVMRCLLGR